MYVAVTRARRRLYISHAQSRMLHGQVRYNIPSRFLDEIPEALLKRINSRAEAKPSMHTYAAAPARSQSSSYPWRVGQAVMHQKFGQGVVVSYEGNADDLRVQVNFGSTGMKWLALEYAKLTPV